MTEPEWVKRWQERLEFLLAEEAKTFDHNQKFRLTADITEARTRLAEWQPPRPPPPPGPAPTRLSHGAPELFGRDDDLAWLERQWATDAAHVATVVAWGGTGKTSLVAEWRNRLLAAGRAPDWLFEWSFYSQGVRDRGSVSADNFIRKALIYFGDPAMADSPVSGREKGTRLAALIREHRALLILDGLEPLQYPDGSPVNPGALKDDSIEALLSSLAQRNPGLCVVTTRVRVAELERFGPTLAPRLDLEALSETAGANLLRSLLEPSHGEPVQSTLDERKEISREVHGHALTLQLLGIYIQQALRDIRGWREIDFSRANEEQGGHAYRVMDAYVIWLAGADLRGQRQLAALRLLGFFDRPADPGCIAALRVHPPIQGVTEALDGLDARDWNTLTASLEQLRLVTRSEYTPTLVRGYDDNTASFTEEKRQPAGPPIEYRPHDDGPDAMVLDAHPLIREYFARELRQTHGTGWREGHRRLYEHLCRSVPFWPEGIECLQPLYQAIVHGCAACMADACAIVYWKRINRSARFYSRDRLGLVNADLAALACFFERTWDRPSTDLDERVQSWVLHEAGLSLRRLGRLREALGPIRAGFERHLQLEDWPNTCVSVNNLSELELKLGNIIPAIEWATRSVEYADHFRDDFHRLARRTTLAEARHQFGDITTARALFEEAEAIQARFQPPAPRLYSVQGHRYCDWLLRPAERESWRGFPTLIDDYVQLCSNVIERAMFSLELITPGNLLLSIALDHLTLGRAALYAALLLAHSPTHNTHSPTLSFTAAHTHLDTAVDGLRRASALDDLPSALITRARLLHYIDPPLALVDLDEAATLAERGPMPLFQADIHLTRARLFQDRKLLIAARQLIERHHYGRRLDELTDAEAASATWPEAPT